MISYWIEARQLRSLVYIPKYYNPLIMSELEALRDRFNLYRIGDLEDAKEIEVSTGDEIGKLAYGTGDIPFVRTSDISNWEIKSAPKQGVSQDVFEEYAAKQDIREGDILLVRDGTYLIGTNCFITELDTTALYQSHILKIRILNKEKIDPWLFFVALNCDLVQRQIRSVQFTADIIDTIGNRYREIVIPIVKSKERGRRIAQATKELLEKRVRGKAFIRQCPFLIEQSLLGNTGKGLESFLKTPIEKLKLELKQDTVRSEFGEFQAFWKSYHELRNRIFIPKYYDPSIEKELAVLSQNCSVVSLGELKRNGIIDYYTGDEIGKMAYGTGTIPFIRTSDFSNWEIKHDPKHGVSEVIYDEYAPSQDVQANDIFIVRDGTYLVGLSCLIDESDAKCLYCGGLYKLRVVNQRILNPWLMLALLNSYVVRRQFRSKQFTRDVIDTLGNRIDEVLIPIPRSEKLRTEISEAIRLVISTRVTARNQIKLIISNYLKVHKK